MEMRELCVVTKVCGSMPPPPPTSGRRVLSSSLSRNATRIRDVLKHKKKPKRHVEVRVRKNKRDRQLRPNYPMKTQRHISIFLPGTCPPRPSSSVIFLTISLFFYLFIFSLERRKIQSAILARRQNEITSNEESAVIRASVLMFTGRDISIS